MATAPRPPVQTITWRSYEISRSELVSALSIGASGRSSVEIELTDDGVRITVKEAV